VNNLEQWFIAPASVIKGIADIKTLQEQRARRDQTRRVMTDRDGAETAKENQNDTSGHDASQPDTSDLPISQERGDQGSATQPDMTRHRTTDIDIFDHPYVKRPA